MIPAYARARRRFIAERMRDLADFAETDPANREEPGGAEVGIIAAGVRLSVRAGGCPGGVLPQTGHDLPAAGGTHPPLCRFGFAVDVIEELGPFLTTEIAALGVSVAPLPESLRLGELNPSRVRAGLRGEDATSSANTSLIPRPPSCARGARTAASSRRSAS